MPSTENVDRLPNEYIAVLALYDQGGAERHVDLEEIAVKCYTLAQERFSWMTRDHPNLAITLEALNDAKRARKHPPYVSGSNRKLRGKNRTREREGYTLTPEGVRVAVEYRANVVGGKLVESSGLRLEDVRVLTELRQNNHFARRDELTISLQASQIAEIVGYRPDVPRAVIEARLQEYLTRSSAAELSDITEFLTWLMEQLNS